MTPGGELRHGFVLHMRPYRERSRLVELWTLEEGRVSAVGRPAVPLFQPCLLAWRGRAALKTLTQCEQAGLPLFLEGEALFAGFYLNELLVRLLPPEDPQPTLFAAYGALLAELGDRLRMEAGIREFEKQLLVAMGYALDFSADAGGAPLDPDGCYRFRPGEGFIPMPLGWRGEVLIAIESADYGRPEVRRAARDIMRLALAEHLGDKPLKSRELWLTRSQHEHSAGR